MYLLSVFGEHARFELHMVVTSVVDKKASATSIHAIQINNRNNIINVNCKKMAVLDRGKYMYIYINGFMFMVLV